MYREIITARAAASDFAGVTIGYLELSGNITVSGDWSDGSGTNTVTFDGGGAQSEGTVTIKW